MNDPQQIITQQKKSVYFSHVDNPVCTGTGYKAPNLHTWGPGIRDVYALHYIVNGKGYYEINDVTYTLHKGESFIIFPHMEVYYYPDQEEPWEYVWVEFKGAAALHLLSMTRLAPHAPTLPVSPEDLEPLYNVSGSNGNKPFERERSNAKLHVLLTYYMEYFPGERAVHKTDYVISAQEYIESYYWNPDLSVHHVVDFVNINRSYLFRLFKDTTGMSISGYLTAFRVQRACDLLKTTLLSVKTVAYSVGYEDPLYFSKVFKKVTSYNPTEYKSRHTAVINGKEHNSRIP
ncbi:AraC family transcriptional regulator [Paenibacillus sp. FSL R7-0273]|uniref:AraC family transcriptional regulator n=1 Tax=Paenibacillus sp. FSL R7-0273 TaxID=1536772 RepID=UPI00063F9AE3|nr:AraC family transcriptional regulator [Paenibacillus sp. FSL R7-0273]OMF97619.1 AraC family transcriptional regulator [Paenibacillus sp. FSL R7-0273]